MTLTVTQRLDLDLLIEGNSITTEGPARGARDLLLADTDVWALADFTMTVEQTDYRQALRDITDQAGFPNNITWPTKPE